MPDGYSKIKIKNSSGEVVTYNDWKIRYGGVVENYAEKVTLAGSKIEDTIENYGDEVLITGQADKDSITNGGDYVTINGGAGDDLISLGSFAKNNLIRYASGDGDDTVYSFNSDDTLHITKGSYKAEASGDVVIVTVGKGKITLKDAAGQQISIKNSKGKVTTQTYGTSELLAENNFVANDLDLIIENKSAAALDEFKISTFDNLAAKTSLTSGFEYDKN